MWRSEHSIVTTAKIERVWALWQDIDGWSSWNAGLTGIRLCGRFETGSTFTMTLPDGDAVASTLIAVEPGLGFTDKTAVGDVLVVVHHTVEPLANGENRITYRAEVSGPGAAEVGKAVTEDFDAVLAALRARAEAE